MVPAYSFIAQETVTLSTVVLAFTVTLAFAWKTVARTYMTVTLVCWCGNGYAWIDDYAGDGSAGDASYNYRGAASTTNLHISEGADILPFCQTENEAKQREQWMEHGART